MFTMLRIASTRDNNYSARALSEGPEISSTEKFAILQYLLEMKCKDIISGCSITLEVAVAFKAKCLSQKPAFENLYHNTHRSGLHIYLF